MPIKIRVGNNGKTLSFRELPSIIGVSQVKRDDI